MERRQQAGRHHRLQRHRHQPALRALRQPHLPRTHRPGDSISGQPRRPVLPCGRWSHHDNQELLRRPLHIASADGTGISWDTTDQQDTTRLHTDQQSGVLDRPDYTPFGSPLGAGSASSSGRGFTGQRNDKDNGLLDLNARYYDAELGRFISADPALPASTTTQSSNPYSYAQNNPVSLSDPSGLCVAAQETCLEVPQSSAPVLRMEAMDIVGNWVAPEDRVHASCPSCTLFDTPPPEKNLTLGQAMEQGLIREGPVSGVTTSGMPIQPEGMYDNFGVQMGQGFAELGNLQAQGLGFYSAAADLATASATKAAAAKFGNSRPLSGGNGAGPRGPQYRDFAHGTSTNFGENIMENGLNEGAAKAASRGGLYAQRGAFFTFEVSAANKEGMQLAADLGARQSGRTCVIVCRMPASLFDELTAQELVRVGPIPGTSLPETVFQPGAFPKLNEALRTGAAWWYPMIKL